MELLKFMRYNNVIAFACILLSLWIGPTSAIQMCHHEQQTTHLSNLDMNSTISATTGMCTCKIQLLGNARLSMFPTLIIPNCSTVLSLSDTSFEFHCINQEIKSSLSYHANKTNGEVIWLFVKSSNYSKAISGNLQIKTTVSQFSLECFDANKNTSSTTPIPTTTTFETPISITVPAKDGKGSSSMQTTSPVNPYSTKSSSVSKITPTVSTSSNNSPTVDYSKGGIAKKIPVAAVAGGIAGGLLLILIIIFAVSYCRRRRRRQPSKDQEYENRACDSGVGTIGEMEPENTLTPDNTNHVHVENDLYVSAGTDNQPHHPQVDLKDSLPGHNASPGGLDIDKSEDESVEGSEIVITSSGDLYAVVDDSRKNQGQLVIDTNPTASLADLYAVVDPTMKHQNELLFHPNLSQDDEYAVVNKKQDPQDLDTTHTFSPSGDVYAVVDKKNDPQVIDPNHMMSPSGDVYAVVDKKPEADQNDQMARTATYDAEEEEAIRKVMDMNDKRPSSDTLLSTSL